MKNMEDSLGLIIPKGASDKVNDTAKEIIKKYGKDKLTETCKLNFKNTEKL